MTLPRPIAHLRDTMRRYPEVPSRVDEFLAGKGTQYPDWPGWCFIPMAAWAAVVQERIADSPAARLGAAGDIAILGALAPWRYSQGIYRYDPDVLAALATTGVAGDLPADVLLRLPEWCVYIESPGLTYAGNELHGFFAHNEWDANTGRAELRLLLDLDAELLAQPLHLGAWTVEEAVQRVHAEAQRNMAAYGVTPMRPDAARTVADLGPVLSLLLYLCSDEPEVDDARQPGARPGFPAPRKVKRGWKLFPPDAPRVWRVGERIGETLRASAAHASKEGAALRTGEGERRSPRAHLRRAHWHGYWTGQRGGVQRFVYHWLPPQVVGGHREE